MHDLYMEDFMYMVDASARCRLWTLRGHMFVISSAEILRRTSVYALDPVMIGAVCVVSI